MKKLSYIQRVLSVLLCGVICVLGVMHGSFISYADVNDLMIGTGSNALMTMVLDESDYSVMPMSSIGTVINTVDLNNVSVHYYVVNPSTGADYTIVRSGVVEDNALHMKLTESEILDGYYINNVQFYIRKAGLPPSGKYNISYDLSSNFSYPIGNTWMLVKKSISNANDIDNNYLINDYVQSQSGDIYVTGITVDLKNITHLGFYSDHQYYDTVRLRNYDAYLSIRFQTTDDSVDFTLGSDVTTQDYEQGVSSSLSDLSSSVDTMTDEISGVTEAIQILHGAMEPHYSNVLTQLHHITEQLHAFYDQVYNNIHLPELDMLTQIKTAIENIDLQIEVDISEVKTAINNMSTAVQNKLQFTTDQITNGYDNSGIVQENEKLEQSINDYDEVESEIFDEAGNFVGEFEYPSVDSLSGSVIKALAFVGSFLQSIFLSMGDFSSIITFSLTMIFVMVVVGYHRIRS